MSMNDNGVYTGLNVGDPAEESVTAADEQEVQEQTEATEVIRLAQAQLLELLNTEKNAVLLITDLPDPKDLPASLGPMDVEIMARKRYINLIESLVYRLGGSDA